MCTEKTNLFLPTSFCGSFQFKECYQTSKTKVILGERKMLLDRQIFTLDGIATELPYYQYMYVDMCSEAGLLQGVSQVESTLCWQECFAWEL